jgi:cytochrome b561
MGLKNTTSEFGSMAKLLHWLVAIGIFALIWFGLEQAGMERGPERSAVRAIHGSIALIVFALMSIRLIWRLMNEVPAHPYDMPGWQKLSATLVHWGIYVAVFVQLIAGPMTVATGGNRVPFLGLFSIPLPIAENHDNHEFWEEVHKFTWKIVALLLVVHVLASLYNHFIAKNDVLRRMTTGIKS